MTDGQIVFFAFAFILSIVNLIMLIVFIKTDSEFDEEYKEKFSIIYDNLKDYRSHKEKVEKVLKLEKDN